MFTSDVDEGALRETGDALSAPVALPMLRHSPEGESNMLMRLLGMNAEDGVCTSKGENFEVVWGEK
jgi:hypothetical protein